MIADKGNKYGDADDSNASLFLVVSMMYTQVIGSRFPCTVTIIPQGVAGVLPEGMGAG